MHPDFPPSLALSRLPARLPTPPLLLPSHVPARPAPAGCGDGFEIGTSGSNFCNACAPGTYRDATIMDTCEPCPPGTSSAAGAGSCTPCTPGVRLAGRHPS
jgi:hypothetical protein